MTFWNIVRFIKIIAVGLLVSRCEGLLGPTVGYTLLYCAYVYIVCLCVSVCVCVCVCEREKAADLSAVGPCDSAAETPRHVV